MFGIIFVCLLMSTLLAVACFGIHFFTHSQPVLNQLIWLEALFCFIILEHCAMIETHIQKNRISNSWHGIRYDWHTFNWTVWMLFSKIDKFFYIIIVEIHLLFGSVYGKVRFFLSNTFHFDEKLKKIHANAYHDPYPCMWYL